MAPGPLPLPPAAFDIVGSRDSISRIPDKQALKAEVFGVLRPGGALSDNSTKIWRYYTWRTHPQGIVYQRSLPVCGMLA